MSENLKHIKLTAAEERTDRKPRKEAADCGKVHEPVEHFVSAVANDMCSDQSIDSEKSAIGEMSIT